MRGWSQGLSSIGAALSLAALLAACGGSGSAKTTPVYTGYAASAPTTILSDAVQATARAGSYRAVATQADGATNIDLRVDAVAPSTVSESIGVGADHGTLVVIGTDAYLSANQGLLQAKFPTLPDDLAGQEFRFPAGEARKAASGYLKVAPRAVAACLEAELRRDPKVVGTATIAGQAGVEIESGSAKFTAKVFKLWVATAAPHFPLRFSIDAGYDAPVSPGCSSTLTDATGSENVVFSAWDATHVVAPPGAVDVH